MSQSLADLLLLLHLKTRNSAVADAAAVAMPESTLFETKIFITGLPVPPSSAGLKSLFES